MNINIKNNKKLTLVLAIVLTVIAIFLVKKEFFTELNKPQTPQKLSGKNSIKSMKINQGSENYDVEVTYYFNGLPKNTLIAVLTNDDKSQGMSSGLSSQEAKIGLNTVKLEVRRPITPMSPAISTKVIANLGYPNIEASLVENFTIEWPDLFSYHQAKELKKKSPDELYKLAVQYIDSENASNLGLAKSYLEKIVIKNPLYVDAYPEFARIVMRNNWSMEGLSQAEQHLNTGLAINKNHVNSHILLGYVYTNQDKLKAAEDEFMEAQKIGTDNLWLWTNWGDLWMRKKNLDKAAEMYQKAIASERTTNSYDRARLEAYKNLTKIYISENDLVSANKLLAQRENEYQIYPCFYSEHAKFEINHQFNIDNAIELAQTAIDKGCKTDFSRNTLGIAYYLAWNKSDAERKNAYIGLARTFFPEGPQLYLELSKNKNTLGALKSLVKIKNNIDSKSPENHTALSIALMNNDFISAKRLINLGASLTERVGRENFPIAFIPIFNQSTEGMLVILSSTIKINEIKYNGQSALDFAKNFSNQEVIRMLEVQINLTT